MKAFVITLIDLEKSVKSAQRCIESAKKFDVNVDIFKAITPKDSPLEILKSLGISHEDFNEIYSRKLNGISCFLSHYMLWKKSIEINETILIFEHDAIVIAKIPEETCFEMLLSLGKPSFGAYKESNRIGVNKLFSKSYLPGAHAYMIKPCAAKQLIDQTKMKADYTDIFLNKEIFPWIEEYYPWPVICDDSFTTVQHEKGCRAKHNYNREKFEIL
jgi:GR25 family glycosyltransferase involved in LPS biosynthesis